MDMYLEACIEAAKAGGKAISEYKPKEMVVKTESSVGHHAIVTSADYESQEAILRKLNSCDSEALLMAEEHVKNENFKRRLVRDGDLYRLPVLRVYIIDELDGSSSRLIGHYEWSISVGYVDRMDHVAGAIFAPKIDRGTLFYASRGNGTFVKVGNKSSEQVQVANRSLKDAYVIVGVDCFLKKYPVHNNLLTELGDIARTINGIGSCALGFGLVASGRADALVQPLQSPWDWAAGKVLIEEAGGSIVFYEMENERINPVEKLEPKHYTSDKKAVGFVAGNERIVNEIMEMLT